MTLALENNLTRKLEAGSCKIVGSQLKARIEEYERDGKKLEPKVKQQAEQVLAQTNVLHELNSEELLMATIDTYTDRAVSGLESNLSGTMRVYNAPETAPLSEEQQKRASAAALLHATFFSDGLKFLNLKHRKQWVKLDEINQAINRPDIQSAIQTLGITLEIARIQYWIKRYGEALGITQVKNNSSDAIYQAINAWHSALKKLATQTHAHYDDDKNEEHLALRRLLLSPYDEQAEEERKSERAERKLSSNHPSGGVTPPPSTPLEG